MDWRSIESAPRDGTDILACACWKHADGSLRYSWIAEGYLDEAGDWVFSSFPLDEGDYSRPTHWAPLPAAPKDGA